MKIVNLSAVKARAARLDQPDMVEKYLELAISENGVVLELTEEDHAELNEMWDETAKSQQSTNRQKKPCNNCRGL